MNEMSADAQGSVWDEIVEQEMRIGEGFKCINLHSRVEMDAEHM